MSNKTNKAEKALGVIDHLPAVWFIFLLTKLAFESDPRTAVVALMSALFIIIREIAIVNSRRHSEVLQGMMDYYSEGMDKWSDMALKMRAKEIKTELEKESVNKPE